MDKTSPDKRQSTPAMAPELALANVLAEARATAPESFAPDGRPLNLVGGDWKAPGHGKACPSPIDGSTVCHLPMVDLETANRAVDYAAQEFAPWSKTDLDERRSRVATCLDGLRNARVLLARLLLWEIGKTMPAAQDDVDRCIDGVAWYLGAIEGQIGKRTPLGLVSNIASWNYPMSVLMHAALVQALAGNSVIAKTPTDGGVLTLTVAFAIARRAGLPVSLISGSGGKLAPALVQHPQVACLAFVGGKPSGRNIAATLVDKKKRFMLEMEGVNAYGIWRFSDWANLESQMRKGFSYGKQRCTAYVRFVIQRELFPHFLETYWKAIAPLRVGNPTLLDAATGELAEVDFGPLIASQKVEELREWLSEAIGHGAIGMFEGKLDEQRFLPGQDSSTYLPPSALLGVPRSSALYHHEPFGPIDTFIVVDRKDELLAEMNVSNGALVGSIACDDAAEASTIASELRAFKVGINKMRSRGDRDEAFGGVGGSWKGCFVGGRYLVQGVTVGDEPLYGNFQDQSRLPEGR